jgi:hypothetical protein
MSGLVDCESLHAAMSGNEHSVMNLKLSRFVLLVRGRMALLFVCWSMFNRSNDAEC